MKLYYNRYIFVEGIPLYQQTEVPVSGQGENMGMMENEPNIPGADAMNEAARMQDQPLLPFQLFFLDYQLYSPRLNISNITLSCRIPAASVDVQALKKAVDRVFHHYAIFGTVFTFNAAGELVQRYRPELIPDIEIFHTDEDTYLSQDKPGFVKPYKMLDSLLWRHQILVTPEHVYLMVDLHHSISDKNSCMNFFRQIFRVLDGEEPEKDYYYLYLSRLARKQRSEEARRDLSLLKKLYGGSWSGTPNTDMESRDNANGRSIRQSDHSLAFYRTAAARHQVSLGAALSSAALLALSRFNQESRVQIAWEYHGRKEKWEKDLVGITLCALPFAMDFDQLTTPDAILQDAKKQSDLGKRFSEYSYALHDMSPCVHENMAVCYLPGDDDPGNMPEGSQMSVSVDALNGMMGLAQILITESGPDAPLTVICAYQKTRYRAEHMDTLARLFLEALNELLNRA